MEWWLLDREALTFKIVSSGPSDAKTKHEFLQVKFELQKADQDGFGMTRCCTHGPCCLGSFSRPVIVLQPDGRLHPALWCTVSVPVAETAVSLTRSKAVSAPRPVPGCRAQARHPPTGQLFPALQAVGHAPSVVPSG